MLFTDAAADYLNAIRHERGLSKVTAKHYASWLHHFTDWLSANGYPTPDLYEVFTVATLRRYQYTRAKTGIRPRTMLSTFAALRGLGEFLVQNGLLETNPVKALTMPKKDAAIRLTVTDAEVEALFAACDRMPTPRQVALSRAVLSVLAYGALRRDEACNLHVEDVNLSEKSLLVRSGKGSKSRRIFVCQDAVNALREWLAVREKDSKHSYLFSIDKNRRLHHIGIAHLIEALKAAADLRGNEAIKPHGLRHWAATNLLRNGANIKDVQLFLGHSELVTTARYLHSSEEQLRDIGVLTALRTKRTQEPPTLAVVRVRPEESRRDTRRRRIAF